MVILSKGSVTTYRGKDVSYCGNALQRGDVKRFIEKAQEVHGDTFTYDKVVYTRATDKVIITCKTHGNFKQTPNSHLSGRGCSKCSGRWRDNTKEWVEKAREVHGSRYSYDRVIFTTATSKVIITCNTHGAFEQVPNSHLRGHGCDKCAREKSNYDTYKDKPTTLYYIKFVHPETQVEAWKIGLTLKTIEERFKPEIDKGYKVEIISAEVYQDGFQAYLIEQKILNKYQKYRPYDNTRHPYLYGQGNTEVFNKDVSMLYKSNKKDFHEYIYG